MTRTINYRDHLAKDKILSRLISEQGPIELKKRKNICLYLCSSIMSQQLSVKVAAVIFQRFLDLFKGEEPDAAAILRIPKETLRSIGLSNAKCNYVHNVAAFAAEHGMETELLDKMSDEEVISYLTPIKGVGRWTVEMLLMFALGREDVFAVDDLGIQNAICRFYKLDNTDKKLLKEKMLKKSKKWSPYRTYACMHLWKGLAVTPIVKA
ncbi:MAG: DNA-3-methyladenine glycosylase 2 family protein [Chitinophagaceae bacterium]|nr:MAG: DNA-3-methyladenine glycosylase 2 family protein [Chitinophagaceae bacterium]